MRGKLNHIGKRHRSEPIRVKPNLRRVFTFKTNQSRELAFIRLQVLQHIFFCEAFTSRPLIGWITDHGGKIPDEQDHLMTKRLKLSEFLRDNGMTDM